MKTSRSRWALFGACAALVVAAMAWVTHRVVSLERSRDVAEAATRHQERVRLALWRMDSAMGALLAREGAQPWTVSSGSIARVYGARTTFDDERVRARFIVVRIVDPIATRAPRTAQDAAIAAALERMGPEALLARIRRDAPALERVITAANDAPKVAYRGPQGDDDNLENRDRQQRLKSASQNAYGANGGNGINQFGRTAQTEQQTVAPDAPSAPPPGTLVPIWLATDAGPALGFVRAVDSQALQGFVLDWSLVSASLLDEARDLLPDAALRPVEESKVATDDTGLVLATAPALLDAPFPAPPDAGWTPTRTGLGVAWLAVLAALAATGLTMRATVADGERRARFASSVTHELRTPLTTFRLYSEMLADGMVRDPVQQQEYLATLKTESARLAALVENVLAYARVEEGRLPRTRERVAVAELLERALPPLRRRCDGTGGTLVLRDDAPDAVLDVNPDAIGQILANLVDNACKYAPGGNVEVNVDRRGPHVAFAVRDHGPGIAPENLAAAFTPFERANRPPGDVIPGIGLGLALSRGLARDLGGDLVYEQPADGPGARFVLLLPTA